MPQPTHAIAGLGLQRQVSCLGLHRSAWPSLALRSFWLHPLLCFLLQRQPEDMETGSLFRRQGCGAMSCDLSFSWTATLSPLPSQVPKQSRQGDSSEDLLVQKRRKCYQESGKRKDLQDSQLDKISLDQDQVPFKSDRVGTRG